ncbi:FG-GAP-like repeat-containing protein [Aureispira sp. CCB-E]|uniref:FG-GAP-like repeat-containing protein n=1 Tax=Aureispira sp. CCB-E TaxID=3051121 RepID=UPI0028696418|nr:FG-GAP-like repeat-containing protein [Aureispira sp. CCB-E]WMX16716.1 FG-GAP-like repeat-containing protein [Aureispira sp. CCB-E]
MNFRLIPLLLLSPIYLISQENTLLKLLPPQETNITFTNKLTEDKEYNIYRNSYFYNGAGVAIGDINNDGLPDIYFTGNMVPNKLYINKGNLKFKDITKEALPNIVEGWCTGVTMVDINNDGFLDIYVSRSADIRNDSLNKNLLFINNQDLTFSEQANQYNLNDSLFSTQAAFFDYDLDGDLDAYIMNIPGNEYELDRFVSLKKNSSTYKSDHFYINESGKYIEQSQKLGIQNNSFGLGLSIGDLNNDGYPDIYVSNDFEIKDYMYINLKDSFVDKNLSNMKHISNFGMGTDINDFNNDGHLDLIQLDMAYSRHIRSKMNMPSMFPTAFWARVRQGNHYQYMLNSLQINNGNATFSDIALLAGVAKTDWSWGALMADFDNDGYKDLVITNGYQKDVRDRDTEVKIDKFIKRKENVSFEELFLATVKTAPKISESNFIFRNKGDLSFENVTNKWGLDKKVNSNGLAYADLDNDGDLDLVINNLDEVASIYENTSESQNNYLLIQLIGPSKNTFAIGTRVTIYTGKEQQMSELFPTRGFQSSVDYKLHFGIGKNEYINKIVIRWPDQKTTILRNIRANQILKLNYNTSKFTTLKTPSKKTPIFKNISQSFGVNYQHTENHFNDFNREVLLPHMLSRQGPSLAVGDINNDGLDDIFIGASKENTSTIFTQEKNHSFVEHSTSIFEEDIFSEDVGALFFDYDNDNDLDLYVCSGGNEYYIDDYRFQDRLYQNNNGQFKKTDHLPKMYTSTQVVKAADFDQDGDLDLFVGGRLVPGKYPSAPRSYLLQNNNGQFIDVTEKYCQDLMYPGMVTGAEFGDVNGDGLLDLTLLGEWMPMMTFLNKGQSFEKMPIQQESESLWFSLKAVDLDNDGDLDFVGGNLGKNCKFKGNLEKPFNIYADDFDDNGTWDMMMSSYEGDKNYPVRGRDCSSEQMPFITDSFPTFKAYAIAEITEICGPKIDTALHLTARGFYTSVFLNDGKGQFTMKKLPNEAQFSPTKDILVEDVNKDGHIDLILVGNMYDTEVETVRYDAGRGTVLLGNGRGSFAPLSPVESGFFAWDNVKQIRKIKIGKRQVYLLAVNNGKLMAFEKIR